MVSAGVGGSARCRKLGYQSPHHRRLLSLLSVPSSCRASRVDAQSVAGLVEDPYGM